VIQLMTSVLRLWRLGRIGWDRWYAISTTSINGMAVLDILAAQPMVRWRNLRCVERRERHHNSRAICAGVSI
jgi:hypothetical protein